MPFFFRPNVWRWWARILVAGLAAAAMGLLLVYAAAGEAACAAYPVLTYVLACEALACFEYDCQAYSLYEYPAELACMSQEDILRAFEAPPGACASCLCGHQVKQYYVSRETLFAYALKDAPERGGYLAELQRNERLIQVAVRRIGAPAKTV